jgi:hypothetical protein
MESGFTGEKKGPIGSTSPDERGMLRTAARSAMPKTPYTHGRIAKESRLVN